MNECRRRSLLFLAHTLPYPPDSGGWIRTYHTLRELSRGFDVTALCFERTGDPQHDVGEALAHLGELAADVEAFPVPQEEGLLRKTVDHARSLLQRRVFTVFKHRSRSYRNRLKGELEEGDHDLIHVESLDLSTYLPLLEGRSVVCAHHNVESQLFRRRAEGERNPLLGRYLALQAELQKREERRWCGRVALNVVVSETDRQTLQRIAPDADVTVIPNGVDVEYFAPEPESEQGGVVFVGPAWWHPNSDAMSYFGSEVLPLLRDRRPDLEARWVGRADEAARRRYREEYGIEMTGYVDDIRPCVRRAACYVVPLRVGGGSRLKILDAWAMGKAVVSTSQGCEGLSAVDGENILVRDSAASFAEAVERVLSDPELRCGLGRRARETVEEEYAWNVIGRKMRRTYERLVG